MINTYLKSAPESPHKHYHHHLVFFIKRFIKQPKYLFVGFLIGSVIIFFSFLLGSRIKDLGSGKPPAFHRQLFSDWDYKGEIKGILTASLAKTDTGAKIAVERENSKLEFDLPIQNVQLSSEKGQGVYKSPDKIIEARYQMIGNGVKEEIILNKIPTTNTFTIPLKLENLIIKVTPEGIPIFFDSKTGEYVFNFERPFVKDGTGKIFYGVKYYLQPVSQNTQTQLLTNNNDSLQSIDQPFTKRNGKYVSQTLLGSASRLESRIKNPGSSYLLILEIDKNWLHDPKRILPIIIDPTVTHNTTAQFATGTLNRLTDTGSGASPSLESNYHELTGDINTVGFWHVNEASGNLTDSSGNNNTGTVTGASVVTGKFGNARSFNGTSSDYVTLTSQISFADTRDFTLELWYKGTDTAQNGDWGKGLLGRNNTDIYANLILRSGYVEYLHYNAAWLHNIKSNTLVADGNWHHIAYVNYGATETGTLYIDGVPEVINQSSSISNDTYPFRIDGFMIDYNSVYTSGTIDEIKVSNVARAAEAIKQDAQRFPYSVYTSPVVDLTVVSSWTNLTWLAKGVSTGDGEMPISTTGLVAQWNFNETSNTTAASGGSCGATCNGTLTGFASTASQDQAAGTGWTANNRRWGAGALMFDGSNDYVQVNDNDSLSFTNNIVSIEFWVNKSKTTGWTVFKGSDSLSQYEYSVFDVSGDYFGCSLWTTAGAIVATVQTKSTVSNGSWHHIACTSNASVLSIYVDGVLSNTSTSFTGSMSNTSAPLYIGTRGAQVITGTLDSTRIYSRALTAAEILANYQAGNIEFQTRTSADSSTWEAWKPITSETQIDSMDGPYQYNTTDSGLVSYWPMDETSSATVNDAKVTNIATASGTTIVDGKFSKGRGFNGTNDLITAADSVSLDITSALSVEAWIKRPTSLGTIASKWDMPTGSGFTTAGNWSVYDTTAVNNYSRGFYGGVFDGRYIYLNQYYNGTSWATTGQITRYDTQASFTTGSSWTVYDINTYVSSSCKGFIGGTFDGRYVYFAPHHNGSAYHGVTCRYDTTLPFTTASSWSTFNIASINGNAVGFTGAAFDGRYVYYTEYYNGSAYYAAIARYDTTQPFTSSSSWSVMDVTANVSGNCRGFYSGGIFDGKYIYFSPYYNGAYDGVVCRYDTTLPFTTASSWSVFDSTAVNANSKGFMGGSFDGRYVYFTQYYNGTTYAGQITRYDTTQPFTSSSSWNVFDTQAYVSSTSRGFYGSIFDGRFIYFIQYYNASTYGGQITRYDTTLPFTTASSWSVFDSTAVNANSKGFIGGAFDGRYVYFVPHYNGAYHGQVTRYDTVGTNGGAYRLYHNYSQGGGFSGGPVGPSLQINTSGGLFNVSANKQTEISNWNHVAGTYDGSNLKMYINGIQVNSMAATGTINTNALNLTLGSQINSQLYSLGEIDEVRAYNSALSSSAIFQHAQEGSTRSQLALPSTDTTTKAEGTASQKLTLGAPQVDANTVALWHMDETSGTGAYIKDGIPPSNPISYWKMDEGSGNIADSIGSNTFVPTGTTSTTGKISSARSFNGSSDYLSVSNTTNFNFSTGDFTLSAWIKPNASAGSILSNLNCPSTNGCNYFMFNYQTDTTLRINTYQAGVGERDLNVTVSSLIGAWHHVVAIRSNGYVSLYLDGSLIGTPATSTQDISNGNNTLFSGRMYNGVWVYPFNGLIDEVGIWNRALSTSQITSLYNSGNGQTHPLSLSNANNGTPTGTTVVDGFYGKARSFNGSSDFIGSFPASYVWDSTYTSYEAWVKFNSLNDRQVIIHRLGRQLGINGYATCTANNLCFSIVSGGAWRSANYPTSNLQTNKWYHIAGTWNGNSVLLYVNGVQVANTSYTGGTDSYGTDAPNIGRGNTGSDYFSGVVDEIRISNIARSAEEIAEAYRAGRDHRIGKTITSVDLSGKTKLPFYVASDRPGTYLEATIGESTFANYEPDANTVGLWHLEEQTGSGSYIKDSSGYGNNASIGAGSPTFVQGKFGKARNFNGSSDYLTMGISSSLAFGTGSFSIGAWVKTSDSGNYKTIISKGTSNAGATVRYYNRIEATSGSFHASIADGTNEQNISCSSGFADGNWHYVMTVVDRSSQLMINYVDGQNKCSASTSSVGNVNSGQDFRVGILGTQGYYFLGTIDEVIALNRALSADDIRQAYEYGRRTHPITIDFVSKPQAAYSSGTSVTILNPWGTTNLTDTLKVGDTIIFKENVGGTETIGQANVTAVANTSSTYGTVTVDAAPSFPSGGYTTNATVFKWQREYFDLAGSLTTHRDATTRLTIRVTDGSQGANIWLDDFRSNSNYIFDNTPDSFDTSTGVGTYSSTSITSTLNRYFQYRVISSSWDTPVAPQLTSVSLNYISNTAPNTPSLDLPANGATGQSLTPALKTTATDNESDFLQYKIIMCTDSGMTQNCQTFDQTSSQTGWSGQNAQSGTAYTSGTQGVYTVQSALSANTTYYWKSYAKDPTPGSNTWSSTQGTAYSFTTNVAPNTPSLDLPINGATGQSTTPILKTTTTDTESDYLQYKIVLCTDSGMTQNCQTFDQTSSQTGWSGQNTQSGTAYTSGTQGVYTVQSALSANTTYYWKSSAIDPGGANTWSSTQVSANSFATNASPAIPSLDAPTNGATHQSTTPILRTTTTDAESDYLQYKIVLCTDSGMTQNCQTFDQTASQTGWSGQNAQSGTAYTSGTQGVYTVQSALSANTTYYWKSYAIDPGGSNGWSLTQVTPYSFGTNTPPDTPSLDSPSNGATNQLILPALKTTATDPESDFVRYKIILCTNSGMTQNCQTFDQTASQTGWSGQNTQSGTAYTSGTQGTYTIQTDLSAGTTYYWKSYAKDPPGSNTWSATQATAYSFTTTNAPTAPVAPHTEGQTNPTNVITLTPRFTAIHTDPDGDSANYYQVEVNTNSIFTGTVMWNTGKTSMTTTASGTRSPNITYAGTGLAFNGVIYYWRIKFWDTKGAGGAWSATQQFTMETLYAPEPCNAVKDPTNTQITIRWTDTNTIEDNYYIERSVNGGGFSYLATKAANSTNHVDNNILGGTNSYQYKIKAVSAGAYSNACTTSVVTLGIGSFNFGNLQMQGLKLY